MCHISSHSYSSSHAVLPLGAPAALVVAVCIHPLRHRPHLVPKLRGNYLCPFCPGGTGGRLSQCERTRWGLVVMCCEPPGRLYQGVESTISQRVPENVLYLAS